MQESFIIEALGRASSQNSGILWEIGTPLVAQTVKNLLTTRRPRVRSLGQEDPLEKETATHSSILGEFHGQRSLQATDHTVHGSQRVRQD